MKRVVGRRPHDQVRVVEALPDSRRVTLDLPSSRWPVELEGVFGSDAERGVVSKLLAVLPEQ